MLLKDVKRRLNLLLWTVCRWAVRLYISEQQNAKKLQTLSTEVIKRKKQQEKNLPTFTDIIVCETSINWSYFSSNMQ